MKKKLIKAILSLALIGSFMSCNKSSSTSFINNSESIIEDISSINSESSSEREIMSKSKQEFYGYINNLETFPSSFQYGNVGYHGFNLKYFKLINHEINKSINKELHTITLTLKDELKIIIEANYYENYDAFDWVIYFNNYNDDNTQVISRVKALDYNLVGSNPILKGNRGDHDNVYTAYEETV